MHKHYTTIGSNKSDRIKFRFNISQNCSYMFRRKRRIQKKNNRWNEGTIRHRKVGRNEAEKEKRLIEMNDGDQV